jgi:hypothetical protein
MSRRRAANTHGTIWQRGGSKDKNVRLKLEDLFHFFSLTIFTADIKLWQKRTLLRNMARVSASGSEEEFDPADKYRLESLERELSAEDILFFRALADARLRAHLDHLGMPWLVEMTKPTQARPGIVSNAVKWIGSLWGSNKASEGAQLPSSDEILDHLNRNRGNTTEKIRGYLMQEIPFEWIPIVAVDAGKQDGESDKADQKKTAWLALMDAMYVETELQVRIGAVSASLALLGDEAANALSSGSELDDLMEEDFIIQKGEFEGHAQEKPITSLVITSVAADVKLRPKFSNTGITASIQSIQVLDLCSTMQAMYPAVVRSLVPRSSSASASASLGSSTPLQRSVRKVENSNPSSLTSSSGLMSSWNFSSSSLSTQSSQGTQTHHFLKAVFELNPVSREANQPLDAGSCQLWTFVQFISDPSFYPAFCLVLAALPLEINANILFIADILRVFKGAGLVDQSHQHDSELAGSLTLEKIKTDHHLSLKSSQGKAVSAPKAPEQDSQSSAPRRMIIDVTASLRVRIIDTAKSAKHLLLDLGTLSATTPGIPVLLSSRPTVNSEGFIRSLHTNQIDVNLSGLSLSIRRDPSVRKVAGRSRDPQSDLLFWILERTTLNTSIHLFDGADDHAKLLKLPASTLVSISIPTVPVRVSTGGINSLLCILSSVMKDSKQMSSTAEPPTAVESTSASPGVNHSPQTFPSLRLQLSIDHLVVFLSQSSKSETSVDSSDVFFMERDIASIDLSFIAAEVLLGSNTSVRAKIGGFDIVHRPTGTAILSSTKGVVGFLANDSNLLISPREDTEDSDDISAKVARLRRSQSDFVRASVSVTHGATRVAASLGCISVFVIAPFIKDVFATIQMFDFSPLSSGEPSTSAPQPTASKSNPSSDTLDISLNLSEISLAIGQEQPRADVVHLAVRGVAVQLHKQAASLELRANVAAIRVDDLREDAKHTRILAPLANTECMLDIVYAAPAPSDAFIPLAPLHDRNLAEVSYQQLVRVRLEPFRALIVRGFVDDVVATVNEIVESLPRSQGNSGEPSRLPEVADKTGDPDLSCTPACSLSETQPPHDSVSLL